MCLAPRQRYQVLLLLRLGAELVERPAGQPQVRGHDQAGRPAAAADLLDQDRRADVVGARAAILLGDIQPQQPQRTHLAQRVPGKLARLVGVRGQRLDLFLHEVPH